MKIFKEIAIQLDIDNAQELARICNECDFDVNVMDGRVCVDGKSIMGVMEMVGHCVTLAPVTDDIFAIEKFYRRVKEIGAYKKEGLI